MELLSPSLFDSPVQWFRGFRESQFDELGLYCGLPGVDSVGLAVRIVSMYMRVDLLICTMRTLCGSYQAWNHCNDRSLP